MPWPQEMVLSGWRRLRIPSPAVLGSGPVVCSRVAGPCPTLAGQPGCPASALASVSWRPWQRAAPSSCSATASTWTGGSTETPHSAAACRTVSASAAGGREGGGAWADSQASAPTPGSVLPGSPSQLVPVFAERRAGQPKAQAPARQVKCSRPTKEPSRSPGRRGLPVQHTCFIKF